MPNHAEHVLALLLVVGATTAHLRSLRFTGAFQATATAMTVLLLTAFVIFASAWPRASPSSFIPTPPTGACCDRRIRFVAHLGNVFLLGLERGGLYRGGSSQSGEGAAAALILGTSFVIVLYVAVNAVFLYATPLTALSGKLEVAHIAGTQIFGAAAARITSALICVGLVANVSGMMWVGSRVAEAMGTTYPSLGFFGRVSQTRVPYVALLYQLGIVLVLLSFQPDEIVNYVGSVLWSGRYWPWSASSSSASASRICCGPYRTLGYPVTPIVFGLVTVFCLVQNSQYHPVESLIGAATVLLGIPIYLWASRNIPAGQLRGEDAAGKFHVASLYDCPSRRPTPPTPRVYPAMPPGPYGPGSGLCHARPER